MRAQARRTIGRSVAVFAVSALAAVVIVAVIESFVFRSAGPAEAIRDARQVSVTVGTGIVEPALRDGILTGDPAALNSLDRVVTGRVLGRSIVRVKIWDASGRILYSDEHRLIGASYRLGDDESAALHGDRPEADLSDLSAPENRFERPFGSLLEVYMPVHTPNGTPLLFESYHRYSAVAASGRKVWLGVVPALLIGLAVLALVQVPLAWRMARGLERGRLDRERLLRRAVEASTAERRRIAGDLHDGVVQDFAGLSMSLAAAGERAEADGAPAAAAALREGAGRTPRACASSAPSWSRSTRRTSTPPGSSPRSPTCWLRSPRERSSRISRWRPASTPSRPTAPSRAWCSERPRRPSGTWWPTRRPHRSRCGSPPGTACWS